MNPIQIDICKGFQLWTSLQCHFFVCEELNCYGYHSLMNGLRLNRLAYDILISGLSQNLCGEKQNAMKCMRFPDSMFDVPRLQ